MLSNEVVAALEAQLAKFSYLNDAGMSVRVPVEPESLRELLRVYRAWLDAPVVDVWGGYDEYGITFRADSEAGELAAFQDSRLAGEVVRLVRDGDSGEGES